MASPTRPSGESADGADRHELARAVTGTAIGTNCSVRPYPSRSTSTSSMAPTSAAHITSLIVLPRCGGGRRASSRTGWELRHAGRRGVLGGRRREDVEVGGKPSLCSTMQQRALEHPLGLGGGKPAMMSAPKTTSGRQRPDLAHEARARRLRLVPPLHALEDEIVARRQAQMEVRHQLRGRRRWASVERLVRLDRSRCERDAEPRQIRACRAGSTAPAPAERSAGPGDRHHNL